MSTVGHRILHVLAGKLSLQFCLDEVAFSELCDVVDRSTEAWTPPWRACMERLPDGSDTDLPEQAPEKTAGFGGCT